MGIRKRMQGLRDEVRKGPEFKEVDVVDLVGSEGYRDLLRMIAEDQKSGSGSNVRIRSVRRLGDNEYSLGVENSSSRTSLSRYPNYVLVIDGKRFRLERP